MKSHLLNALFLIDAKKPSYSDRKRAYYQCYSDWAAAKILMAKNAYLTSVELVEKILRLACKFEFTELAMECTRFLRLYYGTKVGEAKLHMKYHELFKQFEETYRQECEIEYYYSTLLIHFVNKKSSEPKVQALISEYYDKCQKLAATYQSYNIQLYHTLIGFMVHTSRMNYRSTLLLCEQSKAVFENKPYRAETPLQIIYYQSLVCHIQLQQYEAGKKAAEHCIALIEEGTYNWFKYQELYFILCMHTQKYRKAYELWQNTTKHKRFLHLEKNTKEIWKIYEVYALFASWINGDEAITKTSFRINRFLNEIPIFSKDKRGLNVAILIAQFLVLLWKGKYDDLIDRAEALNKYNTRYLRQDDTLRSFYFIKLILTVVDKGFNLKVVGKSSQRFLDMLHKSPFVEAKQLHQLEIIPYEDIWSMIIQVLSRKKLSHRA